MPASLAPVIKQRFFDGNGYPLTMGKLYTYEAGSAGAVNKATYRDLAGTVPNTNPVLLDAEGYPAGKADIYFPIGASYYLVLRDYNGNVIWTADNVTSFIGIDALSTKLSDPGAVSRSLSDKLSDYVTVKDFGAKGDSVTSDSNSFNAALASNNGVAVPQGEYRITTPILAPSSNSIHGLQGGRFTATLRGPVTGALMKAKAVGGDYERNGPDISGLTVISQEAIEIGDRTAPITDDAAGQPVYHYWNITRNNIIDIGLTGGLAGVVGVSLTKAFDGLMSLNEVLGFPIGLLLNGCDINEVSNNRFQAQTRYSILETSATTFGSQNTIRGNDFVGSPSDAFIKSTGRHVRIIDNYLEKDTANSGGFIDITPAGVPSYGANAPGVTLSIIIQGNRYDSQGNAAFVVRIYPDNALLIDVEGQPTSDMSTTPSYFARADGTRRDNVPLFGPGFRQRRMHIKEPTFGPKWEGYTVEPGYTVAGDGFQITARNVSAFPYSTAITGNDGIAFFFGYDVVLPAGSVGKRIPVFPGGYGNNQMLAEGRDYEITLFARADLPTGDNIQIQLAGQTDTGAGFGTALQTFTLTNQRKSFKFTNPGFPANYQAAGFHVSSGTSMSDIYFTIFVRELSDVVIPPETSPETV